jgi:hypothetical protein
MSAFGKRTDGPGGRRTTPRAQVQLAAAMHSVGTSQPVSLLDVSRTGARMSFNLKLYVGQEVWLKVPPTDIFGTIVWIKDDQCGIAFDHPFSEAEAARLQAKGQVEMIPKQSYKERLALDKWKNNLLPR